MLLSTIPTQIHPHHQSRCLSSPPPCNWKPKSLVALKSNVQSNPSSSLHNENETLRPVSNVNSDDSILISSAAAVAAALRRATTSPIDLVQRIEKDGKNGLVLPSSDFQRLCLEQLVLFREIVDRDAVLSVYVRPAGSYVMDRLELRRVTYYPGANVAETADIVILIGNFVMPTGLRAAEASLSNHQVQVIPECEAVVFPMVKHPFVVGFLVAELPMMETCGNARKDEHALPISPSPDESYGVPSCSDKEKWDILAFKEDLVKTYHQFTVEQRSRASKISLSLAMAYIMDQKAMLLQQSSWQSNVRMGNLVEQIRGPLSSIRTLSRLLSVHRKRSEISYDIIEDILVQGDRIRDTLQQLQDAVYFTKANIVRYNEETFTKIHSSTYGYPESVGSKLSDNISSETQENTSGIMDSVHQVSGRRDQEMPMPPLTLAAVKQKNTRPCNVSNVLVDLVGAAEPLAHKQQRLLEYNEFSQSLQVAVEESALRQALSNLIEGSLLRTHVGGKVEIVSTRAPAGGSLIVIDDDGPDMHYMTQMHSLTPFGANLFTDGRVEDNMTWNFVAGLTIAREILESYGCVVRVISPRSSDAALGTGGTRIELWLPSLPSDPILPTQEG
ncbi:chloroplast sensor kinase [Tasmannia lanceolata]|uniref:chloroplast sensor kinase n=1 Tax=Tasmannia lanceolata TaxID=3420 RepID=UPI0040638826